MGDDVRVVAPDLPGHGARPPVGPGVTLADPADGVAAGIPDGAHLIGFSLGAMVAQYLAIHRPEVVVTLTSVSSVCLRAPAERAAVLERLRAADTDVRTSTEASLRRWYDGTDVDEFSFWCDNSLSHEEKRRSLELFIKEVVPPFQ